MLVTIEVGGAAFHNVQLQQKREKTTRIAWKNWGKRAERIEDDADFLVDEFIKQATQARRDALLGNDVEHVFDADVLLYCERCISMG